MGAVTDIKKLENLVRPSVFDYLDYRNFLNDWFGYLAKEKVSFSLRALCLKCDIVPSSLYMALSKKRGLTNSALVKIIKYLELESSEANFLLILRDLTETNSVKTRIECYSRIARFNEYKSRAQEDIKIYKYISAWYHVAIREMVHLPDFKADAKWIRQRLSHKLSSKEIRQALKFLLESGLILKTVDGQYQVTEEMIRCEKDVMKLALAQAHEQMLSLASESIYSVPSDQRRLVSFSSAISKEKFSKINEVISRAVKEIAEITEEDGDPDSVYQFSFLSFPLAGGEDESQ